MTTLRDQQAGMPPFEIHAAYFCGHWMPCREISLPIDDLGFRQGVTAVERLRTYGGQLWAVDEHLDRWQSTTRAIQIDGPVSPKALRPLLDELLLRNAAIVDAEGDVGITIFATPGSMNAVNRVPTVGIHLGRLDREQIDRRRNQGQQIVLSEVRQPDSACWPRSIKVRSRIHYYLADLAAARITPGAIGVLTDDDGSVTETSIANLAIVRSGQIISPLPERVLGGVTQIYAQRVARSLSIGWSHRRITPDQLRSADEILLMGTDTGIWFASHVDQIKIGSGGRGEVCRQLQAGFTCLSRRDPQS